MTDRDGLQPAERLWTPWRMSYVGGSTANAGCVFCRAYASNRDSAHLVIHRGAHAFVIINLYPYNTGHIMVVPNDHQHDLAALSADARAEMAELTASFIAGLQTVLGCEGFNVGMNLGNVAGAGIADHLHQHIVPRWRGDANFMPIVGSTKVLPELIPATYARIRADVALQKSGLDEAMLIVFDQTRQHILLEKEHLPRIRVGHTASAWPAVREWLGARVSNAVLIGWAGSSSTRDDATQIPAFEIHVPTESTAMTPIADARDALTEHEQSLIGNLIAASVRETPRD